MPGQCQCGGKIRQHQLTNNREAWTCNECGRYEVFNNEANQPKGTKMTAHDTENGSLLYWAVLKDSDEMMGVTNLPSKEPSRFLLLSFASTKEAPSWTTAHKEDWDFYNEQVNGALYQKCTLKQCPKGTPLSPE
jgi:hypothetical protein